MLGKKSPLVALFHSAAEHALGGSEYPITSASKCKNFGSAIMVFELLFSEQERCDLYHDLPIEFLTTAFCFCADYVEQYAD